MGQSMIRNAVISSLLGLALCSCASLSKQDCIDGDWQQIGLRDGQSGQAMSRLKDHTKACSKYGISPDTTAYEAGRKIGLVSYCKVDSGFAQGDKGKSYAGVCQGKAEQRFLSGYRLGKELHLARSNLEEDQERMERIDRRLRSVRSEIRALHCKSGEEGKSCRKKKASLRDERDDLEFDRLSATAQYFASQAHYDQTRRDVYARLGIVSGGS